MCQHICARRRAGIGLAAGAEHGHWPLSEVVQAPGRRALLDVDGTLVLRPGHFPVQLVASLAVQLPSGATQNLDLSLAQITGEGRLIEAPLVFTGAAPFAVIPTALTRAGRQWVSVTYTGGFAAGAVPYDMQ
jgi:hypothetical protein